MKSDGLNGLKGLAALHVMFGHYCFFLENSVRGFAGMVMPIFFLLSGYGLTLGYGKGTLNFRSFFQNRIATVMPLYWISCLTSFFTRTEVALASFNDHNPVLMAVSNIFGINSWFYLFDPKFPHPFELGGWTINTLLFFYLVFPVLMPRLKMLSDVNISRLLVILYYVQLVPFAYYWNMLGGRRSVTMSPFTRLPVFIMGMLGGIQTQRWEENPDFQDPNEERLFFHDFIPWGLFTFQSTSKDKKFDKEKSELLWKIRTDFSFILLLNLWIKILIKFSIISLPHIISEFAEKYIQLTYVHIMLNFIIGLTRASDSSIPKWTLSTWPFQKLGAASFSLYMIHLQGWLIYSKIVRRPKFTGVPEMLILSVGMICISYFVHKFIENPLKNKLRYKKPQSTNQNIKQQT